MADTEPNSAEAEGQFHDYRTNQIPWYVRVIWILFWCIAIYYAVVHLFPNLQTELVNPP
ncbi:MAG: hypothetical protein AB7O62_20030 [Pirellulales bacterium]